MADERDAYRVLQVDPEAHESVIRAAYRALAELYHPDRDQSTLSTRRMAELNDAYNQVRTRDRREAYDRIRRLSNFKVAPSIVPSASSGRGQPSEANHRPQPSYGQRRDQVKAGPETIDFGRYAGWTIKQLARHDPDYLRWLSRHSSGIRFRRVIEEALAAAPGTARPSAPEKRGRR